MNEVEDNKLIDRVVLLSDQHAFSELVKRHQSALRYSIRQMCGGDEALADDLAQETFIKMYSSLASFKKQSKLSSWLYSIALNVVRQRFRKQASSPSTVAIDNTELEAKPADEKPQGAELDQQQLHRELARAMAKLSLDQRTALHLFMHKQFTHQEIADIMQLPLGSIKTHINRGRVILQQELASWKESSL
ncbi:MAG: RNA polymerase sigma factor [Pseudomonadales bacterium]